MEPSLPGRTLRQSFASAGVSRPLPRGNPGAMRAELTPYPDGPYLLRGDFQLKDTDGREIDPRRRTVALCRCGASRRKPFCDGTHKLIGFRAPGGEAVALTVNGGSGETPSQPPHRRGGPRDDAIAVGHAAADDPVAHCQPGADRALQDPERSEG
jgi:CDGSH-type Zn-finger protein